ncbi:hypothetical protein CY35_20G007800 [Sphagnum magellanicum]|nr:hypothetical protein CY35_20G007800 [Sphagnum magellanicum]
MSRRSNAEKKIGKPDPIYRNRLVNMLVNRILRHGKKSLAYQILYKSMRTIRRVTPNVIVKAKHVGGSTYQVPIEIESAQGKALAIRWLLGASRKHPGRNMAFKLSYELMDAARDNGNAI